MKYLCSNCGIWFTDGSGQIYSNGDTCPECHKGFLVSEKLAQCPADKFRPQDHVSPELRNFLEENLDTITQGMMDHAFKVEIQKVVGDNGRVISVNVQELEAEILFENVIPDYSIRGKFKFEKKEKRDPE